MTYISSNFEKNLIFFLSKDSVVSGKIIFLSLIFLFQINLVLKLWYGEVRNNISLEEAALANKTIQENITKEALSNILNPETYIGLAVDQAQLIINEIESKRKQIK